MKTFLFLLLSITAHATNAPVIWGPNNSAKVLQDNLCFPNGSCVSDSGLGITGPASSVDNAIVVWNGTTGKVVKDSGYTGGAQGFSLTFNQAFNTSNLQATINQILNLSYKAPTISISANPSCGSVFENGATSPGSGTIGLTAPVTMFSNAITNAKFYRKAGASNGCTGSLINTDVSNPPVPSGGNATYNDVAPGFTATETYSASTTDSSPNTICSSDCTYTFIYPYYWGVSVTSGLSGSGIRSTLNHLIQVQTSPTTENFTNSNTYMYFAYPSSYPALTAIFEGAVNVIGSFTLTDPVSIIGLDGNPVNYKVYQSNINSYVGAVSFQ